MTPHSLIVILGLSLLAGPILAQGKSHRSNNSQASCACLHMAGGKADGGCAVDKTDPACHCKMRNYKACRCADMAHRKADCHCIVSKTDKGCDCGIDGTASRMCSKEMAAPQRLMQAYRKPIYFGANLGMLQAHYQAGLGDNLFKKQVWQLGVYEGIKFSPYWGLEFGFETSSRVSSDASIGAGDQFLGVAQSVTQGYRSEWKLHGWNINLAGFLPFNEFMPYDYQYYTKDWQLIGQVGVAALKLKAEARTISVNGLALSNGAVDASRIVFSQNKVVGRVMAGVQYRLLQNVSIRANMLWENLRKFSMTSTNGKVVQGRDALGAQLGLIVSI